jgi:hypothetical protein
MSENPRVAMAAHEWEKKNNIVTEQIVLSGRHFQYQSWFSPDEDLDIRHVDGVVNYIGSRINRYVLAGAEEMDHAHFQWSNGHVPFPESNLFQSQEVYDSSPIEFRSLHTRLRIAIELGMDQRTIAMIQQRIDAAHQFLQTKSVRTAQRNRNTDTNSYLDTV